MLKLRNEETSQGVVDEIMQSPFSDIQEAMSLWLSPQIAIVITVGFILAVLIAFVALRYKPATVSFKWQMVLLMATGLALSVASGWTTWDGMKNFTHEPVLALLITFGIQSVLLVVSFLIGESFANRPRGAYDQRATGESAERGLLWSATSAVGLGAGFVVVLVLVNSWLELGVLNGLPGYLPGLLLKASLGTLAVALVIALILTSGGNLFHRGISLLRVAAQNATLWIMLIACMGASVFFSFDSLFSTIFPQGERARASDIRTHGQIAELVNDVRLAARERRSEKLEQFSGRSSWNEYTKQLESLSQEAARVPDAIESRAGRELRQAQNKYGTLKADLASQEARLQTMTAHGESLRQEVERVRSGYEELSASRREFSEKQADIDQQIAAKTIEAEQESKGLGASARAGEGPVYRGIIRELEKLEFERRLAEQRLLRANEQLATRQTRLEQAEAEVADSVEQIAQQTVKVETARKLLARASKQPEALDGASATKLVADQIQQLEKARGEVLQDPTPDTFDRLDTACVDLARTTTGVFPSGTRQWEQGCRTDDLRAEARDVSQLSKGLADLEASCTASGKLPDAAGTQELISFARRCIQLAGLPGNDIATFNDQVASIDLNRDDMAHRFVVTINAFSDGNRLALLALAIALAIDGLVFASGIFYAQAARSPLSDIPGTDGRPQHELQNILDSALQPNKPQAAAAALEVMRPLALNRTDEATRGYTHEINMTDVAPTSRATISKLLGAAAAIGAVMRPKVGESSYLVRGEVVTYISHHANLTKGEPVHFEGEAALAELMSSVLADDVQEHATTVLKYFEPTQRREHFATRVALSEIEDADDAALVRKVVNASAVLGYVRFPEANSAQGSYFLHRDVFIVLAGLASGRADPQVTGSLEATVALVPRDTQATEEPAASPASQGADETEKTATIEKTRRAEPEKASPTSLTEPASIAEPPSTAEQVPVKEVASTSEPESIDEPAAAPESVPKEDSSPALAIASPFTAPKVDAASSQTRRPRSVLAAMESVAAFTPLNPSEPEAAKSASANSAFTTPASATPASARPAATKKDDQPRQTNSGARAPAQVNSVDAPGQVDAVEDPKLSPPASIEPSRAVEAQAAVETAAPNGDAKSDKPEPVASSDVKPNAEKHKIREPEPNAILTVSTSLTALDFGMDFSDPEFPEGLFESLEDDQAVKEDERDVSVGNVMATRRSFGRD